MALLDRGEEIGALTRLVAGAADGRGGLAVLEGPAGIGKTALLRAAIELARDRGVAILRATGSELESGFPFGVARQLLEGPLDALAPEDRARALAGAAGLAGRVLGAGPPDSDEQTELHVALHALFKLAANLARERPLLIAVDDAHWADQTSLRFLHYLARRLADSPIALLVASRPPTATAGADLLRALLGLDEADVLRPEPLSAAAFAELARRTLGADPAPDFVASCAEATAGNAFLVCELMRALARDGTAPTSASAAELEALAPEAVSDRLLGWMAALPEPGFAVVRSLALLSEAELPLLAAHARVSPSDAREVCARLEQAALLDDCEQLRFAHPLIARAVASRLSAAERSEGHLRAARLLQDGGAPLDASAGHLLAVRPGGDPWVVSVLAEAAAAAAGRGAPTEAIGYLQRALAEPAAPDRRSGLALELGRAQLCLRDLDGTRATLGDVLAFGPPPATRRAAAMALTQACFLAGDIEGALDALEQERRVERDERQLQVLDGNAISLGLLEASRCAVMRERLRGYRRQAQAGTLREPVLNALAGAEMVLRGDSGEEGIALVRRAFDNGLGAFGDHTFAFGWAICALDAHDLAAEALIHLDRGLAEARSRADGAIMAYLLGYRTHIKLRLGRLAEAEADGRGACELMARIEQNASFPLALFDVLVEREMPEEAWRLFCRQEPVGSEQRSAMTELVGARVAIAIGREEEALDVLLSAGDKLEALQLRHPQFAPWRALAAPVADRLGRRALALRLSAELTELAHRTGSPTAIALALRVHGTLHGDMAALARAAQASAQTPDLLEYAAALTDLGSAQVQRGERSQARETLRSALAAAHEAGALTLAARARAELIAAGGRPRRAALKGVEALTPTELQVARLAADGLSNRDISDALFVSLKTVEQHLARVYAKLEIPGRTALADALHAPAPGPAPPAVVQA